MTVDFVKKAAFLKDELEAFYHRFKPNTDEAAQQHAIARLRIAVGKMEAFTEDPGPLWKRLPIAQRWGYLGLVSHVGTAIYELIDFSRVQEILTHNQSESFSCLMSTPKRSERLRCLPRSVNARSSV